MHQPQRWAPTLRPCMSALWSCLRSSCSCCSRRRRLWSASDSATRCCAICVPLCNASCCAACTAAKSGMVQAATAPPFVIPGRIDQTFKYDSSQHTIPSQFSLPAGTLQVGWLPAFIHSSCTLMNLRSCKAPSPVLNSTQNAHQSIPILPSAHPWPVQPELHSPRSPQPCMSVKC